MYFNIFSMILKENLFLHTDVYATIYRPKLRYKSQLSVNVFINICDPD
jgi:hypothetical protein